MSAPIATARSQPGHLGIDSMLPLPPPLEFGGPATTRIVKSVVSETGRSSTTIEMHAGAAGRCHSTNRTCASAPRSSYDDEQGHHEFSMCKDTLSVGRGGSSVWVDVQVFAASKVSREHFRLRRDLSGRFFIQDVSSWGTSVDGVADPSPRSRGPTACCSPAPSIALPAAAGSTSPARS